MKRKDKGANLDLDNTNHQAQLKMENISTLNLKIRNAGSGQRQPGKVWSEVNLIIKIFIIIDTCAPGPGNYDNDFK